MTQATPATPPPSEGEKPPLSPVKKFALGCLLVTLVFFTIACITGAILWRQFHRDPQYWEQNQLKVAGMQPEQLAQQAEDFEKKMLGTTAPAVEGEPDEPVRTLHVTCDEVNAWIAVKAQAWAAHQNIELPPQIQGSMIAVEDGRLVIAFKVESPQVQKIISAPIDVKIDDTGLAHVRILGLRAGDMNVPLWAIPSGLTNRPDVASQWQQLQNGVTFTPVRAIDPHHRLRLLAMEVKPDGLDLKVKTEAVARKKK